MKIEAQNSDKPQKSQLNILAVMCRTFSQMFFWCGIFLFDARKKEYGGFNHFLAGNVFKWKYTYAEISITYKLGFRWVHNDDNYYYDGYHNHILFGCFRLSYGT